MGNVLNTSLVSSEGDNAAVTSDNDWLNLQSSACFNNQYIASIYSTLPKYDGTEIEEKNPQDNGKNAESKDLHILTLFSKNRHGGISVDDFQVRLQLLCALERIYYAFFAYLMHFPGCFLFIRNSRPRTLLPIRWLSLTPTRCAVGCFCACITHICNKRL
jgi:hypothetical protein